jgi:hypothetical protein
MLFLQTEAGALIAAAYIVRIGGLNTRTHRTWHEIDYVHGTDACTTTASAEAVERFLTSED